MIEDNPVKIHLIAPILPAKFELTVAVQHLEKYGIVFSDSYINNGPASIESEFDELFAGPDTVIQAIEAQNNDADAVIVLCMGDPGVAQAREACTIPIIGPGELAMHYAAMLGHKFTIMPTLPRRRSTYEHHARLYGLESRLASVRPAGVPVLEIHGNTELQDKLIAQAVAAVEQDGADVLILGCIGFRGVDTIIADALRNGIGTTDNRQYDVPVIDALPLSVMTAVALVRCGLSHSKHAFPFPPDKNFMGYTIPALQPKL